MPCWWPVLPLPSGPALVTVLETRGTSAGFNGSGQCWPEHCTRNYLVMAWPSLSLPMEAFMEHLPRSSHCDDVRLQPQTRQAHGPSWSRAQAVQRQAAASQVHKRNSVDRGKEEYRPHRLSSRCSRKPLSHEWTG